MSWPAGRSYVESGELPKLLFESGQWHAHNAVRNFEQSERNELLLAAISCGLAVELLAKGLLATFCPSLLAHNGHINSTLLLAGNQLYAPDPYPVDGLRSIGADEAVVRANYFLGTHGHTKRPRKLVDQAGVGRYLLRTASAGQNSNETTFLPFRVRNAAAHMALVEHSQLREAVSEMVEAANTLAPFLTIDEEVSFWGEWEPIAQSLMDSAKSAAERSLILRIAAAQKYLDDRIKGLPEDAAEFLLRVLEESPWPQDSAYREAEPCPCCSRSARRVYVASNAYMSTRFEGTSDDINEWHILSDYFLAYLECHVCNLRLEGAELNTFSHEVELTLVQENGEYVRYRSDRGE